MATKKIAIIGGGIAGLSAAWMLKRGGFDVTLYEKTNALGGHAKTIDVVIDGKTIPIDTGFQSVTPTICPNVFLMAKLLSVPLRAYPLDYTLSWDDKTIMGINHKDSKFWRSVESELYRFTFEMYELLGNNSVEVISCSIGEYLKSRKYSEDFFNKVIPAISGIIGAQYEEFDYKSSMLLYVYTFCSNFVSFFTQTGTFSFLDGSRNFINTLSKNENINFKLNCGVSKVTRSSEEVLIEDEQGDKQAFDEVIMTMDGHLALKILSDASKVEERLLSSYEVHTYPCIIHTDENVLIPNIEPAKKTYIEVRDQVLTVNNTILNSKFFLSDKAFFTTYTETDKINPDLVLYRSSFRHDKNSTYSFEVKRNIHHIQGKNRTWFAGEGLSFASFETAMLSGFVIAEKLGAEYPFKDDARANQVFELIKNLMLKGQENFKLAF